MKWGSETVSEIIDGVGYTVFPDAFDPAPVLSVISGMVDCHVAAGGGLVDGGHRPDVLYVPEVQRLMVKPEMLRLGEELLGCTPGFGSLVVNSVPDGSSGMVPHVDSPYAQMDEMPPVRPVLCVQMIWYLEDVTEASAPTVVVPGSQLRMSKPNPDLWDGFEPVLVKAGTLFVSHGALWHGTAPNKSGRSRPAVISKYFPARARPRWNPFVQIPPQLLPEMVELIYPDLKGGRLPGR